jgi:hypothetical protein
LWRKLSKLLPHAADTNTSSSNRSTRCTDWLPKAFHSFLNLAWRLLTWFLLGYGNCHDDQRD